MAVATRTLTPAEAEAKTEELYQRAQRLYAELIEKDPVMVAIQNGALPQGVLKDFALQWYQAAYPISYAYAENYKRFNDYFKRMKDMENIVTLQAARELSRPGPGGMVRAVESFALAADNTQEDLHGVLWLYPEISGLRDFILRLYRDGTFAEVSALQVGNIMPRLARQMLRGLQGHYRFPPEGLRYWQMFIEADQKSGVDSGGALGTVASNKYILKRVLECEPLIERIDFGIDYVADMSVQILQVFLKGFKKHFWDKVGYGAIKVPS